jgi:hypothetical protein
MCGQRKFTDALALLAVSFAGFVFVASAAIPMDSIMQHAKKANATAINQAIIYIDIFWV